MTAGVLTAHSAGPTQSLEEITPGVERVSAAVIGVRHRCWSSAWSSVWIVGMARRSYCSTQDEAAAARRSLLGVASCRIESLVVSSW